MMNEAAVEVAMDADGVFVGFVEGVLHETKKLTGQEIDPGRLTTWDIFTALEEMTGHAGLRSRLLKAVAEPDFCRKLPPRPGADEALSELLELERAKQIHLTIITSPWRSSRTWMYERTLWFTKRGLDASRVIHAEVKHPWGADVFADDKIEHVDGWKRRHVNAGPDYRRAFLWDMPHNRDESRFHRLTDWHEFFEQLVAIRAAKQAQTSGG